MQMTSKLEKLVGYFVNIIETIKETYFGRISDKPPKIKFEFKEINLEEEYAKNKYFPEC